MVEAPPQAFEGKPVLRSNELDALAEYMLAMGRWASGEGRVSGLRPPPNAAD